MVFNYKITTCTFKLLYEKVLYNLLMSYKFCANMTLTSKFNKIINIEMFKYNKIYFTFLVSRLVCSYVENIYLKLFCIYTWKILQQTLEKKLKLFSLLFVLMLKEL